MIKPELVLSLSLLLGAPALAQQVNTDNDQWWKGNLHTHSFWSDGNQFPDMIAHWYHANGYNFLALTDHNILSEGEKWMPLVDLKRRGGDAVLDKYKKQFGDQWVEVRGDEDVAEVRLKTLQEFRSRFERPGRFMMLSGEEISDSSENVPVHLNATNLKTLLPPVGGATVGETIHNNVRAVREQEQNSGREILIHLNHPNFGWAVTAEEMAALADLRFVEVYNGHPGVNHLGNGLRASVERIWDIANTLRIDRLNSPPLYGLATDDSHNYHGKPGSHPGRAWIMVRSDQLEAVSLIAAIRRGDFYASSGVTLKNVDFDPESNRLSISIAPQAGVTYSTKFIGTPRDYDQQSSARVDESGNPLRTTREYSRDIGQVLATVEGTEPTYQMTGNELYVRALIISDKVHPDPSHEYQFEQAWTQPVGWE